MPRFRRLSLLLIPLLVTALTQAAPGRAQQPVSSRYAFADTTLLRDTLGLHFGGLFPTADSLQMLPDTLRALMIRYRLPMQRLIAMADSMSVPVDSVGPSITRERYNPLAVDKKNVNDFRYNSGYNIARTTNSWSNTSEYRAIRGAAYLNNTTSVNLEQYKSAGFTSLRQTRESTSEIGLRRSINQSYGAKLHLYRFYSLDPGPTTQKETLNEYGVTARTRRQKGRALLAELNTQAGFLSDEKLASEIKRGLSGRADGRVRMAAGQWFTHDVTAAFSTNLARTRRPTSIVELRALDLSTNLQGTVAVFPTSPASLNVNYNLRRTRVDTPADTVTINHIRQSNNGLGASLRLRRDNDRQVTITGSYGMSTTSNGTRTDVSAKGTARWTLVGWAVDANYSDGGSRSDFPRQRNAYGYHEDDVNRSADATFSRSLSPKLLAKLTSSISLGQYRYVATADAATPPSPRDAYRQTYRIDMQYTRSQRLSSGMAFESSLNRGINIDARTAGSNSDTRSYRAEWRWTYRLLTGLTVSQTNQITADYQFYTFAPVRNNLSLNYNTITSLSAVITPRLNIDVQHVAQQQPRGDYTRELTGAETLKLSDESRDFTLRANIVYSPSPHLSISMQPNYQANSRSGTSNGVSEKQRDDRRLDFSGGVNLNLPLGRKGQLTGTIARTYTDQRTTSFQGGIAAPSPRSETDYINGSLQLTWAL